MKNFTIIIMMIIFGLISNTTFAQGYSFTLISNGDYSFTISAIPDFDSSAFEPITQSYGFTIVLPDGITITPNDYFPAGTSAIVTPVDGAHSIITDADPSMADNDLFVITTDTAGRKFAAHDVGDVIPLVNFTVNGMPTTGEISMLDNDSTLANAPALAGALDSFVQVDMIDDGTVTFTNGFLGLTGTTSVSFATLGIEDVELADNVISVYPNPASEVIHITSDINLSKVELYDILGKRVWQSPQTDLIKVDHLNSGVYLLKIYSDKGQMAKKIVIE